MGRGDGKEFCEALCGRVSVHDAVVSESVGLCIQAMRWRARPTCTASTVSLSLWLRAPIARCVCARACSRVWRGVDVWVCLHHGDVWVCVRVCLRRSAHEGGSERSIRTQRERRCLYLPESLSQRRGHRASECAERHHNALVGSRPTYVQGEGEAVREGVDCLRVYVCVGRRRYALRVTSAVESSSAFCTWLIGGGSAMEGEGGRKRCAPCCRSEEAQRKAGAATPGHLSPPSARKMRRRGRGRQICM